VPVTPDLRDTDSKVKLQRGDFVAVPIPISDPTLGTGLVAGAAYFYPQTEAQKQAQPASVTAAAGMYTSNKSYAYGIGQQNYWDGDKWRFAGALGRADLKLELLAPGEAGGENRASWLIDGNFLYGELSRAIRGNWYAGITARFVDIKQNIEPAVPHGRFDITNQVRTVGAGLNLSFDSRDLPLNSYSGRLFELRTLFNDEAIGSDRTYQTYTAAFRAYHSLTPKLVLAWEVEGCKKSGSVALWDACRLGLRGFPATDYMAESSASAQLEARWRFHPRWGAVAFGGAGTVGRALLESEEDELVPSVGVGLRFMVLPAKRINLRLDYGRSNGGEAIYFSVGEAF
jgi:outer membrane protein assembly factor BamA